MCDLAKIQLVLSYKTSLLCTQRIITKIVWRCTFGRSLTFKFLGCFLAWNKQLSEWPKRFSSRANGVGGGSAPPCAGCGTGISPSWEGSGDVWHSPHPLAGQLLLSSAAATAAAQRWGADSAFLGTRVCSRCMAPEALFCYPWSWSRCSSCK